MIKKNGNALGVQPTQSQILHEVQTTGSLMTFLHMAQNNSGGITVLTKKPRGYPLDCISNGFIRARINF